ncbi:MAG TPA: PrsW family glutamic-type intramembrane protease [Bacteroidales bacterium]|nr:PrsW family glutamic-type intramembrane protease [Bacteroidales bacterium]
MPSPGVIVAIAVFLIATAIIAYAGVRFVNAPVRTFVILFILGAVWSGVSFLADQISYAHNILPGNRLRETALYSLVMAGGVRETGKFLILMILLYNRSTFRTSSDGIINTIVIAFGFTTGFVLLSDLFSSLAMEPTRALLTLPANMVTAIILGFFTGLAKQRGNSYLDALTGLAAAVFFHAIYEFCLLVSDYMLILLFFSGSIVIAAILTYKAFTASTK